MATTLVIFLNRTCSLSLPIPNRRAIIVVGVTAFYFTWKSRLQYIFYSFWPVSYPGGPKKDPLDRLGQWPDKEYKLSVDWRFLHAEESHAYTNSRFEGSRNGSYKLTGEPAGRQIWARRLGTAASPQGASRRSSRLMKESDMEMPAFNPSRNPNAADKLLREQLIQIWPGERPDESSIPKTAMDAARKALSYYQMIQCEDGHWAGDYGGPMFLMPGLIIVLYVTGSSFDDGAEGAMLHYLRAHQQVDGGWGTHIECASTMFGTVLSYIAMRLLGADASDEACVRGRAFIHEHGGAVNTGSWAKFWMAVLGVFEWEGVNSIPAELWLLPRWFPFHPGKLWCHCRMVYLPMCYLYSKRWSYDAGGDKLTRALREELYITPYESIDWDAHRHTCSPMDAYSPVHWFMRFAQNCLAVYERYFVGGPVAWLRSRGIAFAIEYIHAEDRQTNYVCIGPVNKALNMLSVFVDAGEDATTEEFQRHLMRVPDYLWVAEDGMKMQGYNGSQCWDTSFALQAIVEAGLASEFPGMCQKAWRYLLNSQVRENEERREKYFRHLSKGGWAFSTAAHGWPISDTTSEGLKGVLALMQEKAILAHEETMEVSRLYDALEVIFSLQNHDGGWATYENNRGYGFYECLNPSEVFGDIMIDYSYVECTSACVTALEHFTQRYPNHRARDVKKSIGLARRFLRSIQRPDGSWYGSWGVCFTYGTWFGIEGLIAAGEPIGSPAIGKAVRFLLSKQLPNGGWGESYLACVNKAYPKHGTASIISPSQEALLGVEGSGVVQTAWACLGLMASGSAQSHVEVRKAVERGIKFIMQMQLPNGDWAQEGITGVFNRSCGITYSQYRNIFTTWALGRYGKLFETGS
jgi:squalene/oxidosqualene cyclase-like protein